MRAPFVRIRERFATSLWLIPLASAALAVTAAESLVLVDRRLGQEREAWYLFGGHPDSARELLSTIASSLMTLTGVVFSITILVLQLASSQFSPRVLRTFLSDGVTRLTMSLFIGSFVFAMTLLPEVRSAPRDAEFVPALAVFVAFVLVLVSIAVFVRYIHHMAHSIRAAHIIRRIADEARDTIQELFPDCADASDVHEVPPLTDGRTVANPAHAGVITSVDTERLVAIAERHDTSIELLARIGDFMPRGAPLFFVKSRANIPADELAACTVIGEERTVHQDPAFAFRQLVDIAERALSPGVNDPTTAQQALDQLHDLLRTLGGRRFPPAEHTDGAGRVRLIVRGLTWNGYVHLALDEIRQYGRNSLQIARRMRSVLEDLISAVPAQRRPVLERQLRLLDTIVAESFPNEGERRLASHAGWGA